MTLLTREFIEGLLARADELDAWLAARGVRGGPEAFWHYVHMFEPQGVWNVHVISYGLDRLDLDKIPLGCKCLKCTAKATEDPACKFASVSVEARTIAGLDAELLAMFWDKPYFVYRLAELKKAADLQRGLIERYCADVVPGQTESERRAEASKARLRSKIYG
jgi:hypothetical protein